MCPSHLEVFPRIPDFMESPSSTVPALLAAECWLCPGWHRSALPMKVLNQQAAGQGERCVNVYTQISEPPFSLLLVVSTEGFSPVIWV